MPTKTKSVNQSQSPRKDKRGDFRYVANIRQNIVAKFGAAFRKRRRALGLTQSDIAKTVGISRSYLSEVECGKENISLERAEKLSQVVGSSLIDLLQEE
jgi:DNA-binding XRE family transcriptional regulator